MYLYLLSVAYLYLLSVVYLHLLFVAYVACATPDQCHEKCGSKLGCSNYAYPMLVLNILPVGATGIVLAAILSALMSSLTSILNSKF